MDCMGIIHSVVVQKWFSFYLSHGELVVYVLVSGSKVQWVLYANMPSLECDFECFAFLAWVKYWT